jgi:hypothetical protein
MPRSSPLRPSATHYVSLALGVLAATRGVSAQNATVCATDQLDWYTSVVGETPCRTYERLRQICDSRCAYTLWSERSATNAAARLMFRRSRQVQNEHARRQLRFAAALVLLQLDRMEPVHALHEVRSPSLFFPLVTHRLW